MADAIWSIPQPNLAENQSNVKWLSAAISTIFNVNSLCDVKISNESICNYRWSSWHSSLLKTCKNNRNKLELYQIANSNSDFNWYECERVFTELAKCQPRKFRTHLNIDILIQNTNTIKSAPRSRLHTDTKTRIGVSDSSASPSCLLLFYFFFKWH